MWTARRRAGGSWPTSRCRPARASRWSSGRRRRKRGRVQADYQGFLGEVAVWSTARVPTPSHRTRRGCRPATRRAWWHIIASARRGRSWRCGTRSPAATGRFPRRWPPRAGAARRCGMTPSPAAPICTCSPTTFLRRRRSRRGERRSAAAPQPRPRARLRAAEGPRGNGRGVAALEGPDAADPRLQRQDAADRHPLAGQPLGSDLHHLGRRRSDQSRDDQAEEHARRRPGGGNGGPGGQRLLLRGPAGPDRSPAQGPLAGHDLRGRPRRPGPGRAEVRHHDRQGRLQHPQLRGRRLGRQHGLSERHAGRDPAADHRQRPPGGVRLCVLRPRSLDVQRPGHGQQPLLRQLRRARVPRRLPGRRPGRQLSPRRAPPPLQSHGHGLAHRLHLQDRPPPLPAQGGLGGI